MIEKDFFGVEMSNKVAGMNPGIGSSGTCNRDGFSGNGRQRFLEAFLHRNRIGLNLPTVEISAFIGQFDEISLCQGFNFQQK